MSLVRFLPAWSALWFAAGCAAPTTGAEEGGAAAPATVNAEEAAQNAADAADRVDLARRKLERAQLDVEMGRREGDLALAKARVELDLARKELEHFLAFEQPQRLASGQLDLQQTADGMSEQQEEMQQLELMYAKDDLADKTKEIVIVRGKRRFERAKQRLELATKAQTDLRDVQLPQQRLKLELAVKDKEAEVMRAEFGAKAGALDKETAVIAAKQELAKAERDLAKAKARPSP